MYAHICNISIFPIYSYLILFLTNLKIISSQLLLSIRLIEKEESFANVKLTPDGFAEFRNKRKNIWWWKILKRKGEEHLQKVDHASESLKVVWQS